MISSAKTEKGHILTLERGDTVAETLTDFCKAQGIHGGFLQAIGAVEEAEFGYYDLDKREYVFQKKSELMEVVSMTGNVALVKGEPYLHIHAVLADKGGNALGGHIKEAVVGGTLEVFMTCTDIPLERTPDEATGLTLLAL